MSRNVPVIVVGDLSAAEFAEPRELLLTYPTKFFDDADNAVSAIAAGDVEPALIVIAASWPGAVSNQSLARLRQAAPLARFVGLLGSWLEGETRSGEPWPGVTRVPWLRWPSWWRDFLACGQHAVAAWTAAATATDDDGLLRERGLPKPVDSPAALVLTAARGDYLAIADLLAELGWRSFRAGDDIVPATVEVVLWKIAELRSLTASLESVLEKHPGVPVVALASFPREEDVRSLSSLGVSQVLAEPLRIYDLAQALARCRSNHCSGTG